jgi:hypothetical protein
MISARHTKSRILGIVVALGVCSAMAQPALAQDGSSATNRAAAEALFDEAKKLMDAKNYAEACPKFAESQRLDPGGGTILNLALCYKDWGKTASAWAAFREGLAIAIRDRREGRESLARTNIAELEPKLVRIAFKKGYRKEPPGLTVSIDGVQMGAASLNIATPIDPGKHEVIATATDKQPWKTTIEILETVPRTEVTIPELWDAPKPVAVGPEQEVQKPILGKATAPVGLTLAAVGLTGIGVGAVFGLNAIDKKSLANEKCPSKDSCPDYAGYSKAYDDSVRDSWISTASFGVGIVAAGVGTFFIINSRRGPATPTEKAHAGLRVEPMLGTTNGLNVSGLF